jgi:hypothetical protein
MPSNYRHGLSAEYLFISRVLLLGLTVLVPCSPMSVFDVAIEANGKVKKIQIKSTKVTNIDGKYTFVIKRNTPTAKMSYGRYSMDDVDIVAFYIVPLDIWYLIPNNEEMVSCMKFDLEGNGKYGKYKDNWELLFKD